ncbi:hypothetical protein PPUJ20028_08100 [Pseudomonas putida]|uniref:Uncharacterized protein n=1 Tax=Pseudomonas putida TaxID=303 RepID=A0AA37VNB6_PSEPU|nr:hypothetical protein PPUJ20028_08100 [Pseudomonas putida]GLO35388.1 hypothetical protein PPUN14671_22210 [Pseudomonas putida]
MARMRWRSAPLLTRKVTDSGRRQYNSGKTTNGNTPPNTKTLRQPRLGIIQALTKPPAAAPSENPQNARVISSERLRAGAYSLTSVLALGMAAPSPNPVRKRRATRVSRLGEKAEAKVQMPNSSTLHSNTALRP